MNLNPHQNLLLLFLFFLATCSFIEIQCVNNGIEKEGGGTSSRSSSKTLRKVTLRKQRGCSNCTSSRKKMKILPRIDDAELNLVDPPKNLEKYVLNLKKKCKFAKYKGFLCQRVKLYTWIMRRVEASLKSVSGSGWIEFARINNETNGNSGSSATSSSDVPRLLQKFGDPVDLFLFQKYREYLSSHELKLKVVPDIFEIKVSPRITNRKDPTNSNGIIARRSNHGGGDGSSSRFLWDPGFNLKLKFPFFKDELKVAISTGPSFLAGIGTGVVLLILKSMFAPFLLGMKYMFYNMFWKEGSPWDVMKTVWHGGGGGGGWHGPGPEPWESVPPPAIEQYDGPLGWSGPSGGGGGPSGPSGPSGGGGMDQKLQYSQISPLLSSLGGGGGGGRNNPQLHYKSLEEPYQDYIPSNGLQTEVEHYDPFYSPLLSRIDAIFNHLGYQEGGEGCRERVICSIYKFPVKYAPYSNLLSAQLSKHQSELKRPITKSPRILRFFKYMKAAKDGQAQGSCMEIYPNCDQDTDSVSSLPMITTFNQLSELMGAQGGGGHNS